MKYFRRTEFYLIGPAILILIFSLLVDNSSILLRSGQESYYIRLSSLSNYTALFLLLLAFVYRRAQKMNDLNIWLIRSHILLTIIPISYLWLTQVIVSAMIGSPKRYFSRATDTDASWSSLQILLLVLAVGQILLVINLIWFRSRKSNS